VVAPKKNIVRVSLVAVAVASGCWLAVGGTADPQTTSTLTSSSSPANRARIPSIAVQANMQARVGVEFEILPEVANLAAAPRFSAENLPPWASLDPSTGRVVGTPGNADVGQYEAITIMAADGAHRITTQPFNITVVGTGGGVATLVWRLPLSKMDGSRLDDLAGYRISYGRDAELLDHSVFIDDPGQTTYEFSTLDSGVWFFAVIAVNASGLEGPPTVPVRKTI
jgi:Putative Ig domain